MTNAERSHARVEVDAARAALVAHLAELEEAANLPKRASRRVGAWVRSSRTWAQTQPAAAAGVALAGVLAIGGIVTALVRNARR